MSAPEEILGGLESLNISKGFWRGYALYVTNERIIGAKMKGKGKELLKFIMGWRGSVKKSLTPLELRGKTAKVPELSGDSALNLLRDVEGRKDFEVGNPKLRK